MIKDWLFLSGFAVAIHKGLCGHGFLAFGLKLVNGDKVAVLTLDHEWGNDAAHDGWVANYRSRANDMSFQNDTFFAEKFIFWLGKVLIGDDLAENFFGGMGLGVEVGHGFVELSSEGGGGIVLRNRRNSVDLVKIIN